MRKDSKWKLSTGRYVEDILYDYGMTIADERPAHSFILDMNKDAIRTLFTSEERDETLNTENKADVVLENDLEDLINNLNVKSTNSLRRILFKYADVRYSKYCHKDIFDINRICLAFELLLQLYESPTKTLTQTQSEECDNINTSKTVIDQPEEISLTSPIRLNLPSRLAPAFSKRRFSAFSPTMSPKETSNSSSQSLLPRKSAITVSRSKLLRTRKVAPAPSMKKVKTTASTTKAAIKASANSIDGDTETAISTDINESLNEDINSVTPNSDTVDHVNMSLDISTKEFPALPVRGTESSIHAGPDTYAARVAAHIPSGPRPTNKRNNTRKRVALASQFQPPSEDQGFSYLYMPIRSSVVDT
ncbi:hypothetical protein BDB01DRAFT_855852 [Pilobolus umbonatus]|nr:hypothetical protein BDB01DRAFT_855852 [Pilobolus umbonatus]